jgi:hypothetical protein
MIMIAPGRTLAVANPLKFSLSCRQLRAAKSVCQYFALTNFLMRRYYQFASGELWRKIPEQDLAKSAVIE